MYQVPPKAMQSRDTTKLILTSLSGFGLNASNLWITSKAPSVFPQLQLHSDVPQFNVMTPGGVYPNVTQVGCYDAGELMSLLGQLESNWEGELVTIWLYANISLNGVLSKGWPKDGYKLHSRVLLVGYSDLDRPYFDMALISKFASVTGYANPLTPLIGFLQLVLMNIYREEGNPSYTMPSVSG